VENMKEAYGNTKSKLDKCLVRDWSKEFNREHKRLADHVEDTIEEETDEAKYHVSKEVYKAVDHLSDRMEQESDHVVQEVDKQQSDHHEETRANTDVQAANTVDELSGNMADHHAAVHQTVRQNAKGIADYVGHISQQVEDLKKLTWGYQKDPIIDQMKNLETSLNDLQSQMTTTMSPIQQELQALSDGLAGVRSALMTTATTTVPPPAPPPPLSGPDQVTEHLSSLKKALEVAGATQHMQALKSALTFNGKPAQQVPVDIPPGAQLAPVQSFVAPAAPVVAPEAPVVAPTAPVQQAVAPAAVVIAAQPPSEDLVTQHLVAIKNLAPAPTNQQVIQAPAAPAPTVQAAPVAAKKVINPAHFHEQLRALNDLLPASAR